MKRKRAKKIIIEVETPETVVKDRAQQNVFKKYASKSKDTKFELVVTKE